MARFCQKLTWHSKRAIALPPNIDAFEAALCLKGNPMQKKHLVLAVLVTLVWG